MYYGSLVPMMKKEILAECRACGGTGLYQGFCESKGEAVVCVVCLGTGAEIVSYTPFTDRKNKRGIKLIRVSRGNFIGTGVGGINGTEMSYKEFQQKFKTPVVK